MSNHTHGPLEVAVEVFDNDGTPETAIQALNGAATVAVALDFGANNPQMREANARRIVACWNACDGIATENLEGKTLHEYVAGQAFITGIHDARLGLQGLGPQLVASMVAGFFVGTGAKNYVEMHCTHEIGGEFTLTMQKRTGKTPHQLRTEAEQQRDELLALLIRANDAIEALDGTSVENEKLVDDYRAAIAKATAPAVQHLPSDDTEGGGL